MNHGGMQNDIAQSAKALMQHWAGSRKQIQFWLRLDNKDDYEIYEIISWFKNKYLFRRSVMLGLKIVWELKQGNVETLLREFPQVKEWLQVQSAPTNSDGGGHLEDINAKLDLLIAEKKTGGYVMQSAIPTPATPKAEVKTAAVASADTIADNFLNMFN